MRRSFLFGFARERAEPGPVAFFKDHTPDGWRHPFLQIVELAEPLLGD